MAIFKNKLFFFKKPNLKWTNVSRNQNGHQIKGLRRKTEIDIAHQHNTGDDENILFQVHTQKK